MAHQANSNKASLLSRWKDKAAAVPENRILQIPDNIAIPLSHEQQRLWFLQQLNPENPFYNYAELYTLTGNLDIPCFKESISAILQKHQVLRSNYTTENGKPTARISQDTDFPFSFHDLRELSTAQTQLERVITDDARYIFDLVNDKLIRVTIIQLSDQEYRLLFVIHHIVTDKWSMGIFRNELARNYTQLTQNKELTIGNPSIQYVDYAYWQQTNKPDVKHLEYWKSTLGGELPTLRLPADFRRKSLPSYKGSYHSKSYATTQADRFFDLCKKLEATPYVVMLSLFYVLLYRYTGQRDILIGTPIAKRDMLQLEQLIGFFNDTLVLRTSITGDATFPQLVKAVKQTTIDAFAHKDVTFDTLVKEINPERSLSTNPFFQVMFLYHKVPDTPPFGSGITISYEPFDTGVSKFDITLYISEDQGNLSSILEYATDVFHEDTISRMHSHFELLLDGILNDVNSSIDTLPMQTEKEQQFYTSLVAQHTIQEPFKANIYQYIQDHIQRNPHKVAVIHGGASLTYAELDIKANKVATALIHQGVLPNDIVGLCVQRSPLMIVGLLGILKSGAAYLPLDPSYPKERIAYINAHAQAKVLLTDTEFTFSDIEVLDLDEILQREVSADTVSIPEVGHNDLAYVIYTSGSTGKPKGVPVTHKNIINSTISRTDFYGSDPEVFLLMSSISFDSSKVGLFWTLCTGGTLVISEEKLEQDVDRLVGILKKHQVSHTLMLPSLYQLILKYGQTQELSHLNTVMVAGEACTPALVAQHFDTLPEVLLYNEYGPTEATVWCVAHKISPQDQEQVPIGKPTANAFTYILDEHLNQLPQGAVGELCIGGQGIVKRYLNDPDKTQEAFIPNPFHPVAAPRLYRTGDLVRYNNQGLLEFLGRKDQQIKLRGYRVELEEIEQTLARSPDVVHGVVQIETIADKSWDINAPDFLENIAQLLSEQEVDAILNTVTHLSSKTEV